MRSAFALLLVAAAALARAAGPALQSASYVAVDADTGAVLFERDMNAPKHPASTTKIMTALLLLENCAPDDVVRAPADREFAGEASMHLQPGEEITVENLLYAILLRSANDACEIAALHVAGSVRKFAEMMNRRAVELGATGTHFTNPHGLHEDDHYTTAHDLALIARAAMRLPEFQRIVSTERRRIDRSVNQEDMWMISRNRLLKDGTADGIKTGYTIPAGHCFVGTAPGPGFRVITVVLDSKDWETDTRTLMRACFDSYERTRVLPSHRTLGRAEVRGGAKASVEAMTAAPVYALLPKGLKGKPDMRVKLEPVSAPVSPRQVVGTVSVLHDGQVVGKGELIASAGVKATLLRRAGWPLWVLSGGLLIGAVWLMRRNQNGG